MTYFVVEAATSSAGTAKAVTEKASYNEASMLYHQTMASMLANESVTEGICTVIDQNGTQVYELTSHFMREV